MNKTKFLLFSILFTTILSAQSTLQGKVFYTVSLKPFSEEQVDSLLKKRNLNKAVQSSVRKVLMNSKDVTGVLEVSKNESLYQVEDKMKKDVKKGLNMTSIVAGGNNKYYINSVKKDYFKQINLGEFLRVNLLQPKWIIKQDTKKIGDYQCFKAVAKIKTREDKPALTVIAWFTPIIPVSFGPKDYFGLPGLILEISYKTTSIKATKIVWNPSKKIVIKKPREGKRMTHEEYAEMNKNFFRSMGRKKDRN